MNTALPDKPPANMTEDPIKKRSHLFHLFVLSLLMLTFALPGLASLPVIDRDEARFAVSSVQMAESGDYVSIRFQDEARNKKPAGSYWAQAMMIKLLAKPGERKIWVQRIPSVLGALLAILTTYWAAIPILGRRGAFIGAAFLAATGLVVFESHMAKTDALLLAASALLLASFTHLRQGGGRFYALLFWIALGFGIMIKGPVIPALACLTLLPLCIWEREEKGPSWVRKLLFWPGPILCLFIILPWSIMIWQATDGQFFMDALGGDFGNKLVGAQENHGGLPGYYLALLPVTFWPATILLIPGLSFAVRAVKGPHQTSPVVQGMRLLLCYVIPFWIVLELVPTKLPNYLLPVYPALALMVGGAAMTLFRVKEFKWSRPISAVLYIVSGIAILTAALLGDSLYGPESRWLYGLAAIGVIAIFISGVALMLSKSKFGIIAAFFFALILSPTLYQFVLPTFTNVRLSDRIVAEMNIDNIKLPREGGPLVMAYNFTEPSLVYHLGTDIRLGDQVKLDSETPIGTVIISDVAQKNSEYLNEKIAKVGLCTKEFSKFAGFNYSRGKPVTLKLSQTIECPIMKTPDNN